MGYQHGVDKPTSILTRVAFAGIFLAGALAYSFRLPIWLLVLLAAIISDCLGWRSLTRRQCCRSVVYGILLLVLFFPLSGPDTLLSIENTTSESYSASLIDLERSTLRHYDLPPGETTDIAIMAWADRLFPDNGSSYHVILVDSDNRVAESFTFTDGQDPVYRVISPDCVEDPCVSALSGESRFAGYANLAVWEPR